MPTANSVATADLQRLVGVKAPGWVFKVRKDGQPLADAPAGNARIATSTTAALAMSNDTIIHVASMSKPMCVTAFVAMLEDWAAFKSQLQNLQSQPAITLTVSFPLIPNLPFGIKPPQEQITCQVPLFLAPLFSSVGVAQELLALGASLMPGSGAVALQQFAAHPAAQVSPSPPAPPPGFVGLLKKIQAGVALPQYSDPFLPLIRQSIESRAAALGLNAGDLNLDRYVSATAPVTIDQLIRHASPLQDGITDPLLYRLIPGGAAALSNQPTDGSASTTDLWGYLALLLSQNPDAGPGYKNDDYTVLGAIIEECTGGYDNYLYGRLFHDARFSDLRRFVTTPARSALYYSGTSPGFTGGNPFPDYRGFSAAGGFYFTANQITDWLYALYTGQSVSLATQNGPLISQAGRQTLFGTTGYFAAGAIGTQPGGWTTYSHNGGTGVGGGSVNGKLGIFATPTKTLTAFFCTNGALDAEPPFNQTMADMLGFA